ncbi:CBU_0592 family membrane protein [Tenacibaculum sp. M341]|uniref:CBU_0592 family membrane protein n=1 Tax=Tenacibaculum sp. M341 TaxID=2530339 RepID=UPI00104DB776|nr:hypothetical protein [Tenacibaculum sp. M341]TCI92136.1 hypothetical protein EYW44_08105 [Tenacibaculum sp. M341]
MKYFFDILGWTGSALIIIAYAFTLLENKKYLETGKYFNLLGGVFIALNCYHYNAIPPFVTNMLWSCIAILTIFKTKKHDTFSE